ncbi:MAG: DUF4365 domain-containing protein [Sphingobacteriia bacterium]|jgi:hypothetical protein
MPKQTNSQKIGSLGHSIVETQIKNSGFWIGRNLNEDFGIDIELEFAPNEVSGKFVKAQIKSHLKISNDKDFITEYLKKSFLRYCYECRVPIILIVVSTETSESWFVWVQKWLIDSNNISNIYNETESDSLGVTIHNTSNFIIGLKREIILIATWENSTQLFIAVRDLANLSLQLYDDKLSLILFNYLEEFKSDTQTNINYLDTLIEKVILLGMGIWATDEGNKVSQMLFKFIRDHGEKLNANHISKLVIRGNDCSRTGINALGVLYDHFPKHAISLKLTERFKNFADPRLHYYCTIKERYLSKRIGWLTEKDDLKVGKLKLDLSSINGSLLEKWANRGDSVIFDYVFEIED